jgi:glutaredoxin
LDRYIHPALSEVEQNAFFNLRKGEGKPLCPISHNAHQSSAGEKRMQIERVPGKNKNDKVFLYALSTCAWCKMTKQFLKDNDVEFEYVDVDKCSDEDLDEIRQDILSKGGSLSYPVIIVNDKTLINGFRKDKIKEILGI